MKILFLVLFGAALTIAGASYLEFTTSEWANLVCSYTYGVCNHPNWAAIGASILFAIYMSYSSWA